jgi:hypothetical protein
LILDILELRERFDREDWIMKDCDSRSWIGGEGLPSRDQVKEKREQRQCRWVSVRGSHKKVCVVQNFSIHIFVHVHGFQWRQSCMYVGLLKERCTP